MFGLVQFGGDQLGALGFRGWWRYELGRLFAQSASNYFSFLLKNKFFYVYKHDIYINIYIISPPWQTCWLVIWEIPIKNHSPICPNSLSASSTLTSQNKMALCEKDNVGSDRNKYLQRKKNIINRNMYMVLEEHGANHAWLH